MGRLDGLRAAVGSLTALPVGRSEDGPSQAWVGAVPLVGLGLGVTSAVLLAGLRGLSADRYQVLLASALVISFLALATRGIHLLGLPPLVATLLVLVQTTALWQAVIVERGTVAIVSAVATGRCALLWAARTGVPVADRDGPLGAVLGTVRPRVAVLGSVAVLLVCAAAGAVDDHRGAGGAAHVGFAVVVGLAAAIAVRRRLGAVTPAVLGAMVEAATAAVLVVMAYDISGR
jgi:adenosylcobinamide-GDP ribazoletransferase